MQQSARPGMGVRELAAVAAGRPTAVASAEQGRAQHARAPGPPQTQLHTTSPETEHPPNGGRHSVDHQVDAIDAARAREYGLLAALLTRAPGQELLDQLAGLTGDDTPLGRAHAALAAAARVTDHARVTREYFDLFVGVGRGEVVPFASVYRTGFLHGRPLAHVRADLALLGIVRQDGVHEPEDHLGLLLEVMAGLVAGVFATAGGPDAAADFFKRHIEPWGLKHLRDVELAPSANFYLSVAQLGRLWLEIEREAFALPN